MNTTQMLQVSTFNSLVDCLCEFSDDNIYWERKCKLVGLNIRHTHAFRDSMNGEWVYVRKYEAPKPRIKLWTAKTAPDNLMIRQSCWEKGTYVQADVARTGVVIQVYCEIERKSNAKTITWQSLSEQFEQRDGSPCHEVKQVST